MEGNLVRRLFVLGGIVIICIISVQSYWLLKTWDLKDQEFDQTVNIVLRKVADRIARFNKIDLPKQDLIQRTASNYYAVNINSGIDANILEDYLLQEMENHSLKTDFEYAVYDCFSKNLVYGNYCKLSDNPQEQASTGSLPTFTDLDYYFVVKFPSRESYLLNNMFTTILFLMTTVLSILFFMYTIWVILRQKRLSELQKDFINNMTHEFKTPISSIKIAAEVLAKDSNVLADGRLSKYATIIKDQNSRLNDQVEKVLNIARIEKDSFELNIENIDMQSTLSSIVDQESLKLNTGTISIDYVGDISNLEIQADKLHFTNVVTNIIDNALKYSVDEPNINMTVYKKDREILLSISDNGIGIDQDNLKKIFDKFYRVNTGNVHNIKGFGLGLFYVKNICLAHEWQIDATSETGQGTTINITIPTWQKKQAYYT